MRLILSGKRSEAKNSSEGEKSWKRINRDNNTNNIIENRRPNKSEET